MVAIYRLPFAGRGVVPARNDRLTMIDVPNLRVRPATVAIVGRPNVGKSALFNRLIGQRLAIVEDTPGVTRDRLYALGDWRGRVLTFVDTGGSEFDIDPADTIASGTRAQAEYAARDADVIVFVVD